MSNEEYKFLMARLDVIDAAQECIIKRQGSLARMIRHPQFADGEMGMMSEALDDYIEAIEKIKEGYEK